MTSNPLLLAPLPPFREFLAPRLNTREDFPPPLLQLGLIQVGAQSSDEIERVSVIPIFLGHIRATVAKTSKHP
jgi:hypothetical protein